MVSTLLGGLLSPDAQEARKRAAWEKASIVPNHPANHARKDAFGWWIVWSDYGNRESEYGWEIDHAIPTVLSGSDGLANLRALHWRNNARLGGALSGLGQ